MSDELTIDEITEAISAVSKQGYTVDMIQSRLSDYVSHLMQQEITLLNGKKKWIDFKDYLELKDICNTKKIRDEEHLKELLMVAAL